MTVSMLAANAAYGQAQKLVRNPEIGMPNPSSSGQNSGPNFGEMLAETVQSIEDSGKQAEKMSMGLVNGDANVVDVVTAISETELAMESLVSVRDRVISAYEEIMRMPI